MNGQPNSARRKRLAGDPVTLHWGRWLTRVFVGGLVVTLEHIRKVAHKCTFVMPTELQVKNSFLLFLLFSFEVKFRFYICTRLRASLRPSERSHDTGTGLDWLLWLVASAGVHRKVKRSIANTGYFRNAFSRNLNVSMLRALHMY